MMMAKMTAGAATSGNGNASFARLAARLGVFSATGNALKGHEPVGATGAAAAAAASLSSQGSGSSSSSGRRGSSSAPLPWSLLVHRDHHDAVAAAVATEAAI
jgi:hypothetical protein